MAMRGGIDRHNRGAGFMADPENDDRASTAGAEARELSPAAQRALQEADARRAANEGDKKTASKEVGGRDGPDPTRYGDWEKGGIASDF
jgi:hypothetical protein